jgi:asparagine synthase (glutamine-hydrolysing)
MCGIAGFIALGSGPFDPEVARAMALRLRHRGPDDEGLWSDPATGVALAQRRLSIVDLSPHGHQPMVSPRGRFIITFNGEIYNHRDIRKDLDAKTAIAWRGHSDTEVLVAAIEHWGLRPTLARLVGMFAFAVWDREERTLSLARDRMGEKPLYYGRAGKAFAFASELKAFRALPGWAPEIDRGALALLLRHDYIPAPYAIYEGIAKLRPGHVLTFRPGDGAEPGIEAYWDLNAVARRAAAAPFAGSREEAADGVEGLLRQSIAGQMVADVPVGAFLSGGIDSSVVTALMQSLSTRPVRTFTIGFEQAAFNEAEHAKAVARHLGTDHTELYVTDREAEAVVPRLPDIYSEPFADSSQIPTFLVSSLARQHVTVSLSGDGGDELFSGYDRYVDVARILGRIPRPLRHAIGGLAALPSPAAYDRLAALMGPVLPARLRKRTGERIHRAAGLLSRQGDDDLYLAICSHAEPGEAVRGGAEPPTAFTGLDDLPRRPGSIERMMHIDLLSYLPDDILVKVDRAAMAVSLETRVPMLDHRLVEFALSLPIEVLRSERRSKWPLRHILAKSVPRAMFERPKMGFGVPLGDWLRGSLRDWAEALLDERRLRAEELLDAAWVRTRWTEFLSGRNGNLYVLWTILMFEAWYEQSRAEWNAAAA